MNDKQAEVLKATAAAQAARERLSGTVTALQGRVNPRTLAREVRHSLQGGDGGPVGAARRHPVATAGVLGVLGLLLVRRARRRRHATAKDEARSRSDA